VANEELYTNKYFSIRQLDVMENRKPEKRGIFSLLSIRYIDLKENAAVLLPLRKIVKISVL
jgi:hypothetical protein